MNRPTYPATWPGTNIIKSQHNAFNWQADTSDSIIAADYTHCTALYNAWRSDQRSGHGKGAHMTWAQYRATQTPKTKSFAHRDPGGQKNGFGANGGTVLGLSDKADKMLAAQGKLLPIKGHALQQGKVLPPRTVRGVPRGGKKVAA